MTMKNRSVANKRVTSRKRPAAAKKRAAAGKKRRAPAKKRPAAVKKRTAASKKRPAATKRRAAAKRVAAVKKRRAPVKKRPATIKKRTTASKKRTTATRGRAAVKRVAAMKRRAAPAKKRSAAGKKRVAAAKKRPAASKKRPVRRPARRAVRTGKAVRTGRTARKPTRTRKALQARAAGRKATRKPAAARKPERSFPKAPKAKPVRLARKRVARRAAGQQAHPVGAGKKPRKPPAIRPPFEAYSGSKPYVFISYSHDNMRDVFNIIRKLNANRYRIWYDEGIEPGNEWPEEVGRAILNASQFMVFMSPTAADSRNVRNEINLATSDAKDILVIYLQETQLSEGLRLQIGTVQNLNRYEMTEPEFLDKLKKVLSTELRS